MSTRARALGLIALATLALPHPSAADVAARVLSSDAHGVTLQVDLPTPKLVAAADGTQTLVVSGLPATDVPGRPGMPFYSTLVALPPGARASARVQQEAPWASMGTASLAIAGKPTFKGRDAANLVAGRDPVEAIADGPWPRQTVEVGEPFSLRRQRMVAIQVRPFRWDASTRQLWWTGSVTVRVDFVGGTSVSGAPAAEDKHWEPVLEQALVNYSQAREWRGRPSGAPRPTSSAMIGRPLAGTASRAAFDETYPEVRVQLDSTGVFELPFDDLAAKGYPSNIPIGQVSVHRHEFVENASPPYITIELPIEVEDSDGDGIFDTGDRILVFVQSWAERARASWPQRAWGDGEVVYATAVSGSGLRMPTRPGWRNVPGLVAPASFPWRKHWEKNFYPFTFPPDTSTDTFHWTEIELYLYRPDTLAFETNDLDTTHSVTVSLNWVGRRIYQRHFEWAQYHKPGAPFITLADSVGWLGCAPFTATVTNPGSTLSEGVNTIRVWGRSPDVANNDADNVGVNWIEAAYWRRYRAIGDYLPCNSAGGTGEIQIHASGFGQFPGKVYDVSDSLSPVAVTVDPTHVQLAGGSWQIDFQDSVATGSPHSYVVFGQPRDPVSYQPVTRRSLTARNSGDYLLVVPEAFLPAMAPLVQLRTSQGLDVVVAPLESVNDELNGGRHADFAIKRLVRYAYDHWNAKFLLLVGDGSQDPQNFTKLSSTDWIPVHTIKGPVGVDLGTEIIPSDPWYVCMENCDLSQVEPVLQDLFVGRLPVASLTEAQGVVNKIVKYENLSGDQSWRRSILLADDDDYSAESFFGGGTFQIGYCLHPAERVFRQINETIADLIHNQAGLQQAVLDTFHLDTMLEHVGCVDPSCNCKDQDGVKQATHPTLTGNLINRLNAGRMWWNFQGHANQTVLTHEDLYVNRDPDEDDKDLLMNDDKPFLFSAFSCHANAFARVRDLAPGEGRAIGEDLIDLPLRGSIGSYASTGYEILPFNGTTHINVAWADAMFSHPPHDTYLGDNGARVVVGETIALALARYLPGLPYGSSESGIGLTYHLLGDPGTRLSIGPPEAAVTANLLPVTSGQRVALHTLGDTLRLEADLTSNVQLTAIRLDRSDAAGTVTIPTTDYTLTPAFPDTAAGGQGGRRYHLSYGTTLVPDSYTYSFHTTDRYGVPGSFDVVFQFVPTLLVNGTAIQENDPVAPSANVTVRVLSPKPLAPASDLTLAINGVPQAFTFTPVAGDASGREWVLSWAHAPYPIDHYEARLTVAGGGVHNLHFRVDVGGNELQVQNPFAFPNPFDDAGTSFSFLLVSGSNVDLQIRVFTTSGHLIYERDERGMSPGYHQLRWDGRDAEGDEIANGVYVYRMLATNGPTKAEVLGRMVKLRKPHHADSP